MVYYSMYIGENKMVDILLKDALEQPLNISALTFLEARILQSGKLIDKMQLFPDVDDERITYLESVLTIEITKTISKQLKPGVVYIRLRMNNPDPDFTDGEEHIDIDEFEAFKVLP